MNGLGGWVFTITYVSRLEQDNGQKYLIVYYDKRLNDFKQAIETALLKHKLEPGECPVLCLPAKETDCGGKA